MKPEYKSYQQAAVNLFSLQTCSQSSADDFQSTVQQEKLSTISTDYSHLSVTDKKNYSAAYAIFEHEMKLYNI